MDTANWHLLWARYWVSDSEALLFRGPDPHHKVGALVTRDVASGHDTPLDAIVRQAKDPYFVYNELALSPDGKRLCWYDVNEKTFSVCDLDGSHKRVFRRSHWSYVGWIGDSAHLYVADDDPAHILVYGLNAAAPPRKVTEPALPLLPETSQRAFCNDRLLWATWPGGSTGVPADVASISGDVFGDSLIISAAQSLRNICLLAPAETTSADVYDWVTGSATRSVKHLHIRLPTKAACWDLQFSPQGDRIAWLLTPDTHERSAILAWMGRRWPWLRLQRRPKWTLWVSRIDGSDMHEVGYIPVGVNRDHTVSGEPSLLAWLPSGKRLSFLIGSRLYTVPAD